MNEHDDWWNEAAADPAVRAALPGLSRAFWWLGWIYNSQRPKSIFGRLLHLVFCWYVVFVTLNGGFLWIPKDRVWGWMFLAVGVLAFCQACGARKVKIVKRAKVKRTPLRAVPEPDVQARSRRRGARWSMRALVIVLSMLLAAVVQHGFHV